MVTFLKVMPFPSFNTFLFLFAFLYFAYGISSCKFLLPLPCWLGLTILWVECCIRSQLSILNIASTTFFLSLLLRWAKEIDYTTHLIPNVHAFNFLVPVLGLLATRVTCWPLLALSCLMGSLMMAVCKWQIPRTVRLWVDLASEGESMGKAKLSPAFLKSLETTAFTLWPGLLLGRLICASSHGPRAPATPHLSFALWVGQVSSSGHCSTLDYLTVSCLGSQLFLSV